MQAALLRRMIDGGIDAILVKIAAAGLTPSKHLGARLAALPAQVRLGQPAGPGEGELGYFMMPCPP